MESVSRRSALVLAALGCLSGLSPAQSSYPRQPIRLVVPFPPAGGTDTVSRLMAEKLRQTTGWAIVIENKPGAGGNIGIDVVTKAKADGYTLGMGQTANLAINPSLYPRMPYDPTKDIVPVALVAGQPVVLVVRPDGRFKSLADLVAAARAHPGSLTMASAGNGTVGHLTGELFASLAGIQTVHVPYKGAAPAVTDLLGGQVDYYFATPQTVVGLLKSGRLRALGVTSARRLPVLPDTATVAEQGYRAFIVSDWKMLVAPTGTPASVISRLNSEVEKIMSSPDTIAQLLAEGSVPMSGSPEDVARFLKSEQRRWAAAVQEHGVKLD